MRNSGRILGTGFVSVSRAVLHQFLALCKKYVFASINSHTHCTVVCIYMCKENEIKCTRVPLSKNKQQTINHKSNQPLRLAWEQFQTQPFYHVFIDVFLCTSVILFFFFYSFSLSFFPLQSIFYKLATPLICQLYTLFIKLFVLLHCITTIKSN